jgi:hypothetical protein
VGFFIIRSRIFETDKQVRREGRNREANPKGRQRWNPEENYPQRSVAASSGREKQ